MFSSTVRRSMMSVAALAISILALSACAADSAPSTVGTADGVVKIEGPLIGTDASLLEKSWGPWEKANHIRIEYTGSANFQEQIGDEAQQGNAPDLAIFEQPGLINELAKLGYVRKLPTAVQSTVAATFPAQWVGYTTTGGSNYAAPLLAKLNGWVFYSPAAFAALDLPTPSNWSELLTLTSFLRSKNGTAPWCEGFASNASSGASGENWIDDLVLRDAGSSVYDQWISHKIPFDDSAIQNAFADAGQILRNSQWVNAGSGGVASINTTSTEQVAQSLESGKCVLSLQSSAFLDDLERTGDGTQDVGPSAKLWAFILPPVTQGATPYTVSGDFVAAFSNDADTVKVQKYLAGLAWAKTRMALGGAISPASAISPSDSPDELLNASVVLMKDSPEDGRLSASDLMPPVVGEGTFLSGMVSWIRGTPVKSVLSTIDGSWPSS